MTTDLARRPNAGGQPLGGGVAVLFALLFVALGTYLHGRGSHVAAVMAAAAAAYPIVLAIGRHAAWDEPTLVTGARALVAVQLIAVGTQVVRSFEGVDPQDLGVLAAWVAFAVLAVDATDPSPRLGGRSPRLLVLAFAILGVLWVVANRGSMIDVLVYQRLGAERLLAGIDPYVFGYPDPYPPDRSALFFGAGLSVDGVLQFGFPYPPLSLLLSTVGYLLADVRFAHVLAFAATGWIVMRVGGGGWHGRVGASLLLTTPTTLTLVEFGWTESIVVLFLALALLFAGAHTTVSRVVSLGLLLAIKQYAVLLAAPLVVDTRGSRRSTVRLVSGVLGVAALVTVPFAVWHPDQFLFSVVGLHLEQPFRPDSMSLMAVAVNLLGTPPDWVFPFAAVLAPLGALWWAHRWTQGERWRVALAIALVMLAFLLVSKQAHINYYLVVTAALCLAFAAAGAGVADGPPATSDGPSRSRQTGPAEG